MATLLRHASLVLMTVVLLAGFWKPHPVPSLMLPFAALALWWPAIRRGQHDRWLFFYIAGIYLYTILRALADDIGLAIRAEYVINVDRFMFFGNVPSVTLQRDLFSPSQVSLLDLAATGVHWSFFVVPHGAFAFIWFRRPHLAPKYAGAVLLTLYIGLLLFWLLPTVPPWLASRQGDLFYAYRVMDFVTQGIEAGAYQELYDTLAQPNPVASVPSIHMALTFLVLLMAGDFAPRWRWPLVAYNFAMAFSLVYLGEHYVFDVVVGMAVAALAAQLLRRRGVEEAAGEPEPERVAA